MRIRYSLLIIMFSILIFILQSYDSNAVMAIPLRVILGDDNRERVTNGENETYPWSAHVLIRHNSASLCSGTLIADNLVLTAAHCAKTWNKDSGVWVQEDYTPALSVIPGKDGWNQPFDEVDVTVRYIPAEWDQWYNQPQPNPDDPNYQPAQDFAILELNNAVNSAETGIAYLAYYSDSFLEGRIFSTAGYPSDKCRFEGPPNYTTSCDPSLINYPVSQDTLWRDMGPIAPATSNILPNSMLDVKNSMLDVEIDMIKGQSGSSIGILGNGYYKIVGVLSFEAIGIQENFAVRITPDIIDRLVAENMISRNDVFTDCTSTLTLATQGNGTISTFPTASQGCGYGDDYREFASDVTTTTVIAVPDPGWQFSHWLEISDGLVADISVTESATITAVFTEIEPAVCTNVTEIPQIECQALVRLYTNTDGPNWTNITGWITNPNPCEWYGIYCEAGQVDRIILQNNNLSGIIPSEIGNLSNLRYLSLRTNNLTGSIPPQLGSLTSTGRRK